MKTPLRTWGVVVIGLGGAAGCFRSSVDASVVVPDDERCRDVDCSGHGVCGVVADQARCWCDIGYRTLTGTDCVVDAGRPAYCEYDPDCDDRELCTDDSCDPDGSCRWLPAIGDCDDGDPSTFPDVCIAGYCIGRPGTQTPWVYGSSTLSATASVVPADGNAYVTIVAVLRGQYGEPPTDSLVVELSASGAVTLSGQGECRRPAANCVRATDLGRGTYVVTASSTSVGGASFTGVFAGDTDITLDGEPAVTFDTSLFTVISSDTLINNTVSGRNLYFTGGVATFDESTRGEQYGDVFVNGGTVRHAPTTTTVEHRLDIRVASLNLLAGAIDVSGLGYPAYWSVGPSGPAQALRGDANNGGGSHGGLGGYRSAASEVGPTYDSYRDPRRPGAGGESYPGGGVVRVEASGACVIHWPGAVRANGGQSGAGGAIRLACQRLLGTAGADAVTADGGAASSCGAGGGGRIALISSADHLSFAGAFAAPSDAEGLAALTSVVHARGGAGTSSYGHGGAGTLFVTSAERTYGDLIVTNDGVTPYTNGGTTLLPSVAGVVAFAHVGGTTNLAVTVTSNPAYGAAYNDFYAGLTLRPDLGFTAGTPANWLDDGLVTIASNDPTYFVMEAAFPAVAAGAAFRSLDVVDHLEVTGGATLQSVGDLYALRGRLLEPERVVFTLEAGMLWLQGGATFTYPAFGGLTDLEVRTGALITPATQLTGALRQTGGSATFTNGLTVGSVAITGDGALTVWSDLSVNGDVTVASSSSAALVAERVTARDFVITAGRVRHPAASTSVAYALELSLSGDLRLTGGSIDVSSLGYPAYWSFGPTGPAQALRGDANDAGGSHGGLGGHRNAPSEAGPTYGSFRDPRYPGAGGESYPGGGVIRVEAAGACQLEWPAVIRANGGEGAAGGSIRLACGSLGGNAGADAITADGGGASSCGAGGGGRIALSTTGPRTAFGDAFAYPTSSAGLDALLAVVHARGGAGTTSYGNGGAGTLYLASSESTHGDLLVDNRGVAPRGNGGTTALPSVAGVAAFAHLDGTVNLAVTVSSPATYGAAYNGYVAGMTLRPDLGFDAGTPNDWLDDRLVTVASNDPTYFVMSTAFPAVAAGAAFRSLDVVDHFEVTGGATLESFGDLYALHGSRLAPDTAVLILHGGMLRLRGGAAYTYPGYSGVTDLELSSGALVTPGAALSGALRVSGGSAVFTGGLTAASVTVSGDGALEVRNDLIVSGDVRVASSATSALVAERIGAANLRLESGRISHPPTTTSREYALEVALSGGLLLTGGSIDVSGLGYPAYWTFGANGPTQALRGDANNSGGSHGGGGGYRAVPSEAGPTYDDYRDPARPGAGGESYPGGGVIRVSAGGACTLDWPAVIRANGGEGGAGGAILLACGSFTGTAAADALTADGGGASSCGAGGGGRIALHSSGGRSSFAGVFAYPTTGAGLTTFSSAIHARGGAGTTSYGNGGAGTIYLASSDGTYGDLIVTNAGVTPLTNGGVTLMPSLAGVAAFPHTAGSTTLAVSVTSNPGYGAAYNDFYVGLRLRPDLGFTAGTPANWLDDGLVTVASNDPTNVVMTAGFPAVSAGAGFRSLDVLDHLLVTGNATLASFGDLYLLHGDLLAPDTAILTLQAGMLWLQGGAGITYPAHTGTVELELTAGSLVSPGTALSGALRVSGGSATFTGGLTSASVAVSGGGALTVWGDLTVNGDITVSSSSTGALVADRVTADDLSVTAGRVSHRATTTTTEHLLDVVLSGSLSLTGGSIDVSSLGYPAYWSFGPSGPSQAWRGDANNSGGSHGGRGGHRTAASEAGTTYDDLADPRHPGAGGESYPGGGVIRFDVAGGCRLDWPAVIRANGGEGGAGGTIAMTCAGFSGTAAANAVTADGGNGSSCGAGGGGRIALLSTGPRASFTDAFAYPLGAALSPFVSVVHARGGQGTTTYGHGGAGTVYVASAESSFGDLIVNNQGVTVYANGGVTLLRATTVNDNHLYASAGGNEATIQFAATPLAGLENLFRDLLIHVYPRAAASDPRHVSHIPILLDLGNGNNSLRSSSGLFPVISDDHDYRFVYHLDRLDVSGNASVSLAGADLLLELCDLHSADATAFEVPSGSSLIGHALASPTCMASKLVGGGSTIVFDETYLP